MTATLSKPIALACVVAALGVASTAALAGAAGAHSSRAAHHHRHHHRAPSRIPQHNG
jgi:hypothetical protein